MHSWCVIILREITLSTLKLEEVFNHVNRFFIYYFNICYDSVTIVTICHCTLYLQGHTLFLLFFH